MVDWRNKASTTVARQSDKTGGGISDAGIFQGLVDSASGETQAVKVSFSNGERSVSLPMPFDSTNSWIRSIPESGQQALLAYRSDNRDLVFLRYLDERPDKKVEQYKVNKSVYRPLLPGEHEIHSSGFAQSYYGQRSCLEMRGGVVRSWLDQDRAEAGQKAPLHNRLLWEHKASGGSVPLFSMGDEERFGVVRRANPLNPGAIAGITARLALAKTITLPPLKSPNFNFYPYPDFSLPAGPIGIPAGFGLATQAVATATQAIAALAGKFKVRTFAKEYLRIIKNPLFNPEAALTIPPINLVDIREGQVFDDSGLQVLGPNGAYLRAQHRYFTSLGDNTSLKVDELGNVNWDLSLAAIKGWSTTVPFGNWELKTGLDTSIMATNFKVSTLLQASIDTLGKLSLSSQLGTAMSSSLQFEISTLGKFSLDATLDAALASKLNMKLDAGALMDVNAGVQMNLKAPMVAVGSSPAEPMVMGTQLSTWLQTLVNLFVTNASFVGTGNMGAPVPLNPAIVSQLNQLLGQIPTLTSKTITLSA